MDENNIAIINSGNVNAITPILKNLIQLNSKSFEFPELNHNSLRVQLWCAIFENLKNSTFDDIRQLCLANIRILSRDKTQLDDVVCEKWINTLLELSGLYQLTVADDEQLPEQTPNNSTIVESLKCLCNLVFNSISVQKMCTKNCMTEGIICRLRTYKEKNIPHDIKFFDMKLLFAITALCPQVRGKVKYEYHGFAYLTESLDEILKEISSHNMELADEHHFINDMQLDLSCEILKTLFNLIIENKSHSSAEDNDETYILRLVTICHSFLLCNASSNAKRNELHNNIVNFLTGIPSSCFNEMAPLSIINNVENNYEYEGRNMSGIYKLIEYLQTKMNSTQNVANQYENLSPILTVMHKAVSGSRYIRKYVRSVILPPLKDVHSRPEEGNTIRNQLCRLLTTPVTHVRDLTAEFLLILCKENVGRMIKYTGYGNAAGHFANRGLLGAHKICSENSQYSSDSEDSDTEEYLAMRHTVNPVTGCYEPPRIDPMAGCSEEQKEYEAMKLVNLMDQLNRAGVIQPCRIGPDGHPEAVEHILQLQEELPNQQISNKKS